MNDSHYQAEALQQPAAMSTSEQPQPQQMTAVSITPRIPDFWRDRPRLHQFNAIVDPQKASDLHKSQLLIARLKPDELPDISDILAPVTKSTPSADQTTPETIVSELKQMNLEISELRNRLIGSNNHHNSRSRDRYGRGTSRTRSKSRENTTENRENYRRQKEKPGDANYLCFYHFTYGTNARKCGDTLNCNKNNSGKLIQTPSQIHNVAGVNNSYRLCVTDIRTGARFLIDTGADVSVLAGKRQNASTSDYILYAANGTKIKTYGEKTITVNLGLRRPFQWKFILADVQRSIIGADFLAANKLIVDLHGRKLIDKLTLISRPTNITNCCESSIRSIDVNDEYHLILQKFPDITKLENFKTHPKHDVQHHIYTNGPPVHEKVRPLNPEKYKVAKAEFERMMQLGICRPSNSPWANPLVCVSKKNGEIRPCGDYRRLNAQTTPDRYPLPRLLDFTYILKGKSIFSKIDVRKAYHNIPMAPEDIPKTAVITPFGLFEFTRMNFGLRNAAQDFQRLVNNALKSLDFAFPYLDDVIIASESKEMHVKHLELVLERLNNYGLTINTDKCEFGKSELNFLGYHINSKGIKPSAKNMQLINDYPQPKTIEELRRFLGMMNFYRLNIPKAAEIQAPLNAYLHNSKKRDKTEITWTESALEAFSRCKQIINNTVTLSHPDATVPLVLMTDASGTCVGAALNQRVNGKLEPLGFYSKKLTDTQTRYSTYDRELLAIYMAIKHFRHLLEGRQLTVLTDHKPLTFALFKKESPSDSPRRLRQLDFISQFCDNIMYIEGDKNTVADALSRIDEIIVPSLFDYQKLAELQKSDSELQNLRTHDKLQFKLITMPDSDVKLACETSTNNIRPYLPIQFRELAIKTLHNVSHPGIAATRRLVKSRYFWSTMNTDIKNYVKMCVPCQKCKIQRHTVTPIGEFESTGNRFEHVHIDIIGPLPPAEDFKYCVTIIDRVTKWPEVIPVKDITAETVAKVFVEHWIARFGCPIRITSDQGRQFESDLFRQLLKRLGIERIRTTAYNPKANGMIERLHRTLKAAIMAKCSNSSQWVRELPLVLLGLRSAVKLDLGYSPSQFLYGSSLRLPGDLFHSKPTTNINESEYIKQLTNSLSSVPRLSHSSLHSDNNSVFVHKDLSTNTHVFVRNEARRSLVPPYEGPYKVVTRHPKFYTLDCNGRQVTVSLDRLKPAYLLDFDNVSVPRQETQTTPPDTVPHPANITTSSSTTSPPVTTKSGRIIKKTVRFNM